MIKFWCFWRHYSVDPAHDVDQKKVLYLKIHIWHYLNYSQNFISHLLKPLRSYSLYFFELYSYIIRFLETLYTSAYRPQLWKFITSRNLNIFWCGFFVEFVWLRRFFSIHSLEDLKKCDWHFKSQVKTLLFNSPDTFM